MAIADPNLVAQYSELHKSTAYGVTGGNFVWQVRACLLDIQPKIVLEYGCGRSELGSLLASTGVTWLRYDPAIPEHAVLPTQHADLVVCTDVMEHVPESDVDDVLRHISSISSRAFFNISTRPAKHILPNGQNAHCTVWDADTWTQRIRKHFSTAQIVHLRPRNSCIILTWSSPAAEIVAGIEELKTTIARLRRRVRRLKSASKN